MVRYYLGKNHPGIYLTQHEAFCVARLLQNFMDDDIGKILNLSPRTVSFYVRNVSMKLKCKDRTQLIETIRQTDFMKYLDILTKLPALYNQ